MDGRGEVSYALDSGALGGALGSGRLESRLSVDFDSLDLNMPEYRLAEKSGWPTDVSLLIICKVR